MLQLTDQDGTANNGRPSSSQAPVQDNRQSLVRDDIAQQERNQNPMLALAQQAKDSLRVSSLGALSARSNDLQVCFVLAHQSNGQAGHDTAEQNQRDGNAKVDVEVRVAGILRQLFFALG